VMSRKESRGCQHPQPITGVSLQLSIPRRGALQRSSSPLPQPSSILTRTAETVHNESANGTVQQSRLCHFWGAPHSVEESDGFMACDIPVRETPRPSSYVSQNGRVSQPKDKSHTG
jgi:hypothetical protein